MTQQELGFWFELAAYLRMSVAQCMAVVDAEEFSLWQAHILRHRWPEDRADRRTALLGWLIALYGSMGKTSTTVASLLRLLDPIPSEGVTPPPLPQKLDNSLGFCKRKKRKPRGK